MAKAPKVIPAEPVVEDVVEEVVETGPVFTAQTLAEMEAGKVALARRIASHHAELGYSASNPAAVPPVEELIKNYKVDQQLNETELADLIGKL